MHTHKHAHAHSRTYNDTWTHTHLHAHTHTLTRACTHPRTHAHNHTPAHPPFPYPRRASRSSGLRTPAPFPPSQTIVSMYDDLASLFGAGTAAELGIQSEIVDRAHRLYPEDEVGTPPQGTHGCSTVLAGTHGCSTVLAGTHGCSTVLAGTHGCSTAHGSTLSAPWEYSECPNGREAFSLRPTAVGPHVACRWRCGRAASLICYRRVFRCSEPSRTNTPAHTHKHTHALALAHKQTHTHTRARAQKRRPEQASRSLCCAASHSRSAYRIGRPSPGSWT
jgi:hypothetical protein